MKNDSGNEIKKKKPSHSFYVEEILMRKVSNLTALKRTCKVKKCHRKTQRGLSCQTFESISLRRLCRVSSSINASFLEPTLGIMVNDWGEVLSRKKKKLSPSIGGRGKSCSIIKDIADTRKTIAINFPSQIVIMACHLIKIFPLTLESIDGDIL